MSAITWTTCSDGLPDGEIAVLLAFDDGEVWTGFRDGDDWRYVSTDLIEAVGGGKVKIDNFDCAVFDGQYVTGDIDEAYLNKIEQARNDASKVKTQAVSAIIDLYNN